MLLTCSLFTDRCVCDSATCSQDALTVRLNPGKGRVRVKVRVNVQASGVKAPYRVGVKSHCEPYS